MEYKNTNEAGLSKQTTFLADILLKIKEPAIFLGVIYLISFILILPFALKTSGGGLTQAKILLIATIAIGLVHILLNWLYGLVVAIPLVMSVIFFIFGGLLWLFAPLSGVILDLVVKMIFGLFDAIVGGAFSLSESVGYLIEFTSRCGQTIMVLAGGLWWLVQKAKDINYKAIAIYLIALAIYGIFSGVTSISGLLMFLVIWTVIYFKISGDGQLHDLKTVFKVVATIAIVFGVFSIKVVDTSYIFYHSSSFDTLAYNNFLKVYKLGLAVVLLTCTWAPSKVVKILPEGFKKYINLISKYTDFIKIKLEKNNAKKL